jgi:VWFA-related protein
MKRHALSFAFGSLLPICAFAQSVPKAQETIDVRVRSVDVVVTDAKGNRISGLAKDDLQLFENGKPREITNFSEMKRGAQGATFTEPPPRRILMLFDVNTLTLSAKRQAVDAARKFLITNLRPTDLASVYLAASTLTRVSPWSGDAATISAALDRVNAEAASPLAADREAAERQIRATIADAVMIAESRKSGTHSPIGGGGDVDPSTPPVPGQGTGTGTGGTGNSRGNSRPPERAFDDVLAHARQFAQLERRDVDHEISMMNAVLGAFGDGEGKRALIVAGGGLPTRPGAAIFAYLDSVREDAQRGSFGAGMQGGAGNSALLESSKFEATGLIRTFGESAARRGITIYALDSELGGFSGSNIGRGERSNSGADFAGLGSRVDGYQMLANLTGGSALLGGSAERSMVEIAKDLDSYYSIGYRTDEDLVAPNLSVKSKSGYRVRAMLANVPKSRDNEMQEVVAASAVAPLETPNDLGITVTAEPAPPAEDGRRVVTLKVMIPVKNLKLERDGDSVTGGFNVYVSMSDGAGDTSEPTKQTHQIKWPADALPGLVEKSVTYKLNVTMDPGRTRISVGVMDQRSEQRGFQKLAL